MTVLEHYKKNLMNSRPFINIDNYPSYLAEYKEKYPKGRETIKQQLRAYITENNGDTINNSYWIKIKKLYDEL